MQLFSDYETLRDKFQRTIKVIFSAVKWQFGLFYLDNIVVFSKSLDEHTKLVYNVLTLLCDPCDTHKLKKCRFFAKTSHYLGHVMRPSRVKIASRTTSAIRKLQSSTTVTELGFYFGLYCLFRQILTNFVRKRHLAGKGTTERPACRISVTWQNQTICIKKS